MARAIGVTRCSCGAVHDFTAESTIDDYAELNRWLGQHAACADIAAMRQTIGDITFAAYCSCGASFIVYGDPSDDDRAASEDFTFEHESCVP